MAPATTEKHSKKRGGEARTPLPVSRYLRECNHFALFARVSYLSSLGLAGLELVRLSFILGPGLRPSCGHAQAVCEKVNISIVLRR